MARRLAKFLALSWPERILLAEAAAALVAVKAGLVVGGVRLCETLIGAAKQPRAELPSSEELARLGLAVRRAAAPLGFTCLPQSLAMLWLLRRRGVAAELRFGAKLDRHALAAHAWVVAPDLDWTFDINPAGEFTSLREGAAG
jgi:hypothetical protein